MLNSYSSPCQLSSGCYSTALRLCRHFRMAANSVCSKLAHRQRVQHVQGLFPAAVSRNVS